jgi:predicted PurR-regulated permease PerM/ActR/RegA family two-component response regulator
MNTSGSEPSAAWGQVRSVLRILFTVLGVLAGFWLIYALAGLLALLVLTVFFAYLLAPAVALVERIPFPRRRSWPRPLAILVVYLAVFGGVTLGVYALAPRVSAQVSELGQRTPGYVQAARERATTLTRVYRAAELPAGVRGALESAASRAVAGVGEAIRQGILTVLGWLKYVPYLVLIPILGFFLLKDADDLERFAVRLLPPGRMRWRGRDLLEEINRTLALYVRVQVIAGVIVGFACSVGFAVLSVPYGLVLGIVAGFLEFVPLVGPLIIAVVATFLASTQSGTLGLVTFLFLVVLRLVQDYLIYPRLVASGMKLHPAVIIITLLCGSHLAGVAGLFLAIPVAAVLMVLYRYLLRELGQESLLAALVRPEAEPQGPPVQVVRASLPAERRLTGISVAVVDDDEQARTSLAELLGQAGATVFFARTATDALALLQDKLPDVLLSDLAMPGQDGYDLIRQVRALPPERGGTVAAAALSGYATEEDRARSHAAGFQKHLSKPVDAAELISTVANLAATTSAARTTQPSTRAST